MIKTILKNINILHTHISNFLNQIAMIKSPKLELMVNLFLYFLKKTLWFLLAFICLKLLHRWAIYTKLKLVNPNANRWTGRELLFWKMNKNSREHLFCIQCHYGDRKWLIDSNIVKLSLHGGNNKTWNPSRKEKQPTGNIQSFSQESSS